MKPLLRNGTYHIARRVPQGYASVEPRAQVWISLHTDSLEDATRKMGAAWSALLETWEARLAGDTTEADRAYAAALNLAQARGFRYLPVERVAELPLEEELARVEAIAAGRTGAPQVADAKALLGTVRKPALTVSKALDAYWQIAAPRLRGKSEDQVRRWKNPRIKAFKNFVAAVGDRALDEISPDDMLDFRDWWMNKLETEGLTPNSANKDFTHFAEALRTVNKAKRLHLDLPLSGWRVTEGEKRIRPPFSRSWTQDRILAPGALKGLNKEARCILLGMINTGYRPSEGACLTRAQIRLDAEVPHISIEPVGRQLKTQYARRVIPLLGVSLAAFKECPDGFPRCGAETDPSPAINKFLRENKLLETTGHTLYSLRHSFQDRMIAAKIDDRTRRDLFGHSLTEERYGEGASLVDKHEAMKPLAL